MWQVQTGKGKSAYTVRYTFETEERAYFYYSCLLVHSGYKKRLVNPEGKVIARFIS